MIRMAMASLEIFWPQLDVLWIGVLWEKYCPQSPTGFSCYIFPIVHNPEHQVLAKKYKHTIALISTTDKQNILLIIHKMLFWTNFTIRNKLQINE